MTKDIIHSGVTVQLAGSQGGEGRVVDQRVADGSVLQ